MSDLKSNNPSGHFARRRCTTLALLAIIFISGALVGAGLTVILRPERAWRGRRTRQQARDRMTQRFADRLDLDKTQTEKLREIIDKRLVGIEKLRSMIRPGMEIQATILDEKITKILDDEQRAEWAVYFEELQQRWFPPETAAATQPASDGG